jgi:hypothetical protein
VLPHVDAFEPARVYAERVLDETHGETQ